MKELSAIVEKLIACILVVVGLGAWLEASPADYRLLDQEAGGNKDKQELVKQAMANGWVSVLELTMLQFQFSNADTKYARDYLARSLEERSLEER